VTPAAVRVRVPATSANLGPAFDCAGLALDLHDELDVAVTDGGLEVTMAGEGAATLPADESHLVVRAFRAGCAELGWQPPGLRIAARNGIPQGRGLGSSAAAVVAGLLAAWALCPDAEVDRAAVLRLADRLEGHPDNVAPCVLGGVTLSWHGDDGARAARLSVDPAVRVVLLVPDAELSTHVARGLLPELVPHGDAAHAAGRSALLVHALEKDPSLLLEATEDRLHQRQRGAAMPETWALLQQLRAAGHAAVVSGAGPSLLVFTRTDEMADDVSTVTGLTPNGWRCLPLQVDGHGASVSATDGAVSS
jgi:homoserine kinase